MLDFAALPPEVNSGLMYTGPGSQAMLAASAAWDALAAELQATASSFGAMISALTDGTWQGPSAAAMAAAAAPQLEWLTSTSGLAEDASAQAAAAAAAYEAAFGATVPPAEVAANRALVAALLATNFIGQNTAAIAAAEAQYAEMWAQDATAMYGYASASAAASTLTPFNIAAPAVDAKGLVAQLTSVSQAISTSAVPKDYHDVPKALSKLAGITNDPPWLNNPAVALGLTGHTWTSTGDGVVVNGMLGKVVSGVTGSNTVDASSGFNSYIRLISPIRLSTTAAKDLEGLAEAPMHFAPKAAEGAAKALEAVPRALGGALGNAAAAMGHATPVGGLSVPVAWHGVGPAATPGAAAIHGLQAASTAEPGTSAFGGLPLMGAGAGRNAAHFVAPRYGVKPTVMGHPLAGG